MSKNKNKNPLALTKEQEDELQREFLRIKTLVSRHVRPPLSVDDIAQDILIETLQNGNFPPSSLLIRNRCIDAVRSYMRYSKVLTEAVITNLALTPLSSSSTEEVESKLDTTQTISLIVEKAHLTPVEFNLIYLKFWQNLTIAQISSLSGLTHSSINTLLHNSLERMKAILRGME